MARKKESKIKMRLPNCLPNTAIMGTIMTKILNYSNQLSPVLWYGKFVEKCLQFLLYFGPSRGTNMTIWFNDTNAITYIRYIST